MERFVRERYLFGTVSGTGSMVGFGVGGFQPTGSTTTLLASSGLVETGSENWSFFS